MKKEREHVEIELAEKIEVPGFRKGKAPHQKALTKISESTIIEHTLQHILPTLLGQAMTEHKLKLAIYPKFELVKANPEEPWEVRATSAEFPTVTLGNYKEKILAEARSNALWTPAKNVAGSKLTTEQKQQIVIKTLLENVSVTIPAILVEEETNSRLSQLLERIERLGLSLDSYLQSVGKTTDTLRSEYEKQSRETLILDLSLNKVADEEGIAVSENDIQSAITASQADSNLAGKLETPEQKRVIEGILRKRAALEKLTELITS